MELTWITQGGFIFEVSGRRLVVDPYLSDVVEKTLNWTRLEPAPIPIGNLRPDTVFCSHNHIDHLDPETAPQLATHYPLCKFMGPQSVTEDLLRMGIDPKRITTLEAGMKIETEGFQVIATPAYHSDPYAIGFVIQSREQKVYLSGDTRYQPTLAQNILDCSGGRIDLVLICINGRMNNMGIDEAVILVKQLQPHVAVPIHYGLFAENTVDPEPFQSKCREIGIRPFLLSVGKPVTLDWLLFGAKES
jgi:L-ascorbate metabolism protein UlaG (beta-lactamase superfamily)